MATMMVIDETTEVSGEEHDADEYPVSPYLLEKKKTRTGSGAHDNDDDDDNDDDEVIVGILYGRSVRSGYACLHLYCPPSVKAKSNNNPQEFNDENDSCGDGGATNDDDDDSLSDGDTILIRLQFMTRNNDNHHQHDETIQHQPVQLRSHIRRFCKPGDLLCINNNKHDKLHKNSDDAPCSSWRYVANHIDTAWQDLRLVIHLESVEQAQQVLQVQERRYWTIKQIQACQEQFCGRCSTNRHEEDPSRLAPVLAPPSSPQKEQQQQEPTKPANGKTSSSLHHQGGLLKRTQGEYLRNFLAHMILLKLSDFTTAPNDDDTVHINRVNSSDAWATTSIDSSSQDMLRVRDYLNQGSGVLDVAGGSGHVSMALGLQGIKSTIVDPRDKVGNLPGRDRKIWNRAFRKCGTTQRESSHDARNGDAQPVYCQPVKYDVYRAWFGTPPEVRYDNQVDLPVCGSDNENDACQLLANCRAVIALHPDEATDAIVDTAVRRRTPFVIVPCCVFYRLFPNRRMPNNPDQPVSTYENLLDYLQAKDPSIQRTLLPFEGANTLLWSIF